MYLTTRDRIFAVWTFAILSSAEISEQSGKSLRITPWFTIDFQLFSFELTAEDVETFNAFDKNVRLVAPYIEVDG